MITVVWLRRDLRLYDHIAFNKALSWSDPVMPVFIFDTNIVDELPEADPRITFIYDRLCALHNMLRAFHSGILVHKGDPIAIFKQLIETYPIKRVVCNRDYEPYAMARDSAVAKLLEQQHIEYYSYKDQLIFEPNEILKPNKTPYTVYTPYKNAWLKAFEAAPMIDPSEEDLSKCYRTDVPLPPIEAFGFTKSNIQVPSCNLLAASNYHERRDFPALDGTSHLGPHLRFGTVSIRAVIRMLDINTPGGSVFLSELIWREFFVQILYHYPHVAYKSFKPKYDNMPWRRNTNDFNAWCCGNTGYPMVDAGMRQLNETGYMHNRVRMVAAGFLCKHLLIDPKWGEAYFAKKLIDYELASNNGNWQWVAGTGCDAAPYFRIFNPIEQAKKFDPSVSYIKKWIPELMSASYPDPIVDHKMARERALKYYQTAANS